MPISYMFASGWIISSYVSYTTSNIYLCCRWYSKLDVIVYTCSTVLEYFHVLSHTLLRKETMRVYLSGLLLILTINKLWTYFWKVLIFAFMYRSAMRGIILKFCGVNFLQTRIGQFPPTCFSKNQCNNHRKLSDKSYGIVGKYVEETWGL
jgi:hypothetical protein